MWWEGENQMNEVMQVEEPITTAELAGRTTTPKDDAAGPLLPADFVQDLRSRWDRIQTSFVDEPRTAVQQADELVASAIKRLAEGFADARNTLEHQWDRGDQVNTEDLRVALTKYRAFFQKLMSV
jgi:hypothetical protein